MQDDRARAVHAHHFVNIQKLTIDSEAELLAVGEVLHRLTRTAMRKLG